MPMATMQERFVGAVLGAAIGDAMGHETEFKGMQAIREKWGPEGVTNFERWWTAPDGTRYAPYTDDTQMAEIVLRTLVYRAEHPEAADMDTTMKRMAAGFIDWSHNPQGGHRAPGGACLSGCRMLEAGVVWSEAGGKDAGGCGSVMRAFPFGLMWYDDPETGARWAVEHSKLTHRHPMALAACAAMVAAMHGALWNTLSPSVIAEGAYNVAKEIDAHTADLIRYAIKMADQCRWNPTLRDYVYQELQGWRGDEAVAAGIFAFLRNPENPRAAILDAANTPGDSDSIATIAGALTGAYCGVKALPEEWIRDVERSDELRALALRAYEAKEAERERTGP